MPVGRTAGFQWSAAAGWAEDHLQLPGFPAGSWVGMISSDSVRLRASPSTTAGIVRSLNTGELCVIEGSSSKPQKIGKVKSRAKLDCELKAGDTYAYFEATRVEAVPVN